MSDFYQEYGLEEESVPAYSPTPAPTKPAKKKGGWLGRIIALLLGFVIGIGACVGACVGGAYYVASKPINETASTLDLLGINISDKLNKYLAEDYQTKTIGDLANAFVNAANQKTLGAFAEISPVIKEKISLTFESIKDEMGIDLNKDDQLFNTEFDSLPEVLAETVQTTPIGDILTASTENGELDGLLKEICYGVEGEDYTVKDGEIVMYEGKKKVSLRDLSGDFSSILNDIYLASVTNPTTDDKTMLALAYGQEGITYVIENGEAVMQQLFFLKNKKGEFTDYHGTVLDSNKYTIEELQNDSFAVNTDEFYLHKADDDRYYAYNKCAFGDNYKCSDPIYFEKTRIGDLTEDSKTVLNNLLLKDVLNVQCENGNKPSAILVALAYGEEGVDFEYVKDGDNYTGIELKDGHYARTIGQLTENGSEIIDGIALHSVISEARDNATIMYLLYGKKGLHYIIDETTDKIVMQDAFIYKGSDGKIYNEYKEEQTTATLDGNGVYTDAHGNKYNTEVTSETVEISPESGPVTLTKYYLYDEYEATVRVQFKATTFGDLSKNNSPVSKMTERMTVGEVLGEDKVNDDKVLKHISGSTINNLATDIKNLTFAQVFEDDIFKAYDGDDYTDKNGITVTKGDYVAKDKQGDEIYIATKNNKDDYTDSNGTPVAKGDYVDKNGNYKASKYIGVDYIDKNGHKVREGDYTDKDGNYAYIEPKGTWKYLLWHKDEGATEGYYRYNYTVTGDMSNLLDNMTAKIQETTLNELSSDGIIHLEETTLNTNLFTEIKVQTPTTTYYWPFTLPMDVQAKLNAKTPNEKGEKVLTLGELTANEILEYTACVMKTLKNLDTNDATTTTPQQNP